MNEIPSFIMIQLSDLETKKGSKKKFSSSIPSGEPAEITRTRSYALAPS
jgi:hypothetical protein